MKNKQVFYWFLDLAILIVFIAEYKLDWTGLQWHETLGLSVFALMLVHLFAHWRWVVSVTKKVLQSFSNKACLCYLIDFGLLFLFVSMVLTGLLISSLLNLSLPNYDFWRFLHVSVSYFTLGVVGLKLAMHWKWIVNTAKRKIFRSAEVGAVVGNACNTSGCVDQGNLNRRQFLEQTGIFSGALVFAGVSYANWLKRYVFSADETGAENASDKDAIGVEQEIVTATPFQPQVQDLAVKPSENDNSEPDIVPTALPTAIPTLVTPRTSVRCTRGCHYPGRCRRYEDSNNNDLCDLSEW